MGLKDTILAAKDSHSERVEVPEWSTAVYIRNMTGTERDTWELSAFKDGKVSPEHFRAKLLVRVITDEQGERAFADDDAPSLSAKSATVLSRLYDVAAKVNGIGPKDVDDLAKN